MTFNKVVSIELNLPNEHIAYITAGSNEEAGQKLRGLVERNILTPAQSMWSAIEIGKQVPQHRYTSDSCCFAWLFDLIQRYITNKLSSPTATISINVPKNPPVTINGAPPVFDYGMNEFVY